MKRALISSALSLLLLGSNVEASGWETRNLASGQGTWDSSVGIFFWENTFHVRNLQIRGDVDLTPGLRWHGVIRSNAEQDTLKGLSPRFDELYLESAVYRPMTSGELAISLRLGETRYLRFAEPGRIADFDQVPGIADLNGGEDTGYRGAIAAADYDRKDGWGAHVTAIRWAFGREGGTDLIENYVRYRRVLGKFYVEGRYGGLAVRPEPLGRRAIGHAVYLGTYGAKYNVGVLVESLKGQPTYTGLQVVFSLDKVTKAAGRVALDYDRNPEGIAMQIPLLAGRTGGVLKKAPEGAEPVGEIRAKRVRTYWQNGQVRNYYEHRLAKKGITDEAGLVCVAEEDSWYLAAESLVSPHTSLGSKEALREWERDRQGPAQLEQNVTYRYYRVKIKK